MNLLRERKERVLDKRRIAILHSGNLSDVSPGGVSEYVAQFIKHSNSDIYLLGTEKKEANLKLWRKYTRNVGEKQYIFIPINYSNRKPISIYYFIHLVIFIILNPRLWKEIEVVYAQRMEYVLPFCLLLLNKKVVMAVHGSGKYASMFWGHFIAKIYSFLEYISIRRSTKVFILNNNPEFGVPYYKKKYSQFKDKIYYTLVPVDTDLFRPLNKSIVRQKYNFRLDEKIILFLGRIEYNPKRVHLLPDILSKVKSVYPKTKLLIVGSGNDKENLLNKLKDTNLLQDTVFVDYIKHGDELVELINCADVSLICSTFEGICMSALESISSGIPVVATNVGDIKEYLIHGENGYLVNNYKDEDAIVKEMSSFVLSVFNNKVKVNRKTIEKYKASYVVTKTESLLLE